MMNKSFVEKDHAGRSWHAQSILCPLCDSDHHRELFKLVKSKCIPQRPADTFVKCKNCGLVYINPRILFPARPINEVPDKPPPSSITLNRLSDFELMEDLERICKYKPAGKLLELGCGTGGFLNLASEIGYKTMGVEPVEEHAVYARDRFGLEVIHGLVGDPRQSIELPSNKFDIVVMIAVLEHVLDVRNVVQAVHRCLRPGGIFYLTSPNVTSLHARIQGTRWNHYHTCWHHQFFSKKTLRLLLVDQGFEVLETWGVYRGRPIRWRRMVKEVLATVGMSLDDIAVLAEKVR